MLILRHINPDEPAFLLHVVDELTLLGRGRFFAVHVQRHLFCDLSLTDARASEEEHDEWPVRVNPSVLAQTDRIGYSANWTALPDDSFTQYLLESNYPTRQSTGIQRR